MPESRFSRTLAISLGSSVTGAGLAFLLAAVVGRNLGPEGTGIYFQSVALFTIVVTGLKLGADTGLVRSMAQLVALGRAGEAGHTARIALLPVTVVATVVALVVHVGAAEWATLMSAQEGQQQTIGALLRYFAPFLVAGAVFYVSLGAVRGLGSVVGYAGLLNVALPVARLLLVLAALSLGMGAVGAVQAWVIALPGLCAVAVVMMVRSVRRATSSPHRPGAPSVLKADPGGWRGFWSFSVGRWAAASVEILLDWVDVLLVGALTDPASAGAYAIATRVARAGQVVDNAMRVAVGPRLSAMLGTGDRSGAAQLFRDASRAMVLLTVPFYMTCLAFAPTILGLFGSGFDSAAPALRVLCAGMMVSAATIMLQSIVLMGGRSHWQLMNKLVALAVAIGANLVLIPALGTLGAAVSWLLAILTDLVLVAFQSYRLTGIRPHAGDVGVPLLGIGAAIGAMALVAAWSVGGDGPALLLHLCGVGLLYAGGALWAGVRSGRLRATAGDR